MEAKNLALKQINNKIKTKLRKKIIVAFLDLNRAFDTVNRQKLIRKLIQRNHSTTLIQTIEAMLSETMHYYEQDGRKYKTNIGVP